MHQNLSVVLKYFLLLLDYVSLLLLTDNQLISVARLPTAY